MSFVNLYHIDFPPTTLASPFWYLIDASASFYPFNLAVPGTLHSTTFFGIFFALDDLIRSMISGTNLVLTMLITCPELPYSPKWWMLLDHVHLTVPQVPQTWRHVLNRMPHLHLLPLVPHLCKGSFMVTEGRKLVVCGAGVHP